MRLQLEKVDILFPFHPSGRIQVKKDETRLKMTAIESEEWLSNLSSHEWPETNFQTECFFMTLECHHLSIIPCLRKYSRRIRAIREYTRIADDLQQSEHLWGHLSSTAERNKTMIRRWREQARRLAKAKVCADAGLLDQALLSRSLNFYNMVMGMLLRSVSDWNPSCSNAPTLPLSLEVPKAFAAYPEWYIEDMADFLLFTVQYIPQVVEQSSADELILFLIVFVCSANYVSSPYLGRYFD